MYQVAASREIPAESVVLVDARRPFDYVDSYAFRIPTSGLLSVDELTYHLFTVGPAWAGVLLRMRDALVSAFGLRRTRPAVARRDGQVRYERGERAVLFTVSHRTEDEIVLAECDRHLDFRCSVLRSATDNRELVVHVTTVVWFNNVWGRCYFAIIRPFHCLILRSMMKSGRSRIVSLIEGTASESPRIHPERGAPHAAK